MSQSYEYNPELPSLVLGGGGPFGIAFEYGIYESMQDAGIDLRNAQIMGTSAGSWVGSLIATGRGYEEIADMPQIKVPNWKKGFLQGVAREVFSDDRAENVRTMAFRLPSWERPMSGAEKLRNIDLADMVAASSAVPGLFRPVQIGGNQYVDGGVRSIVSADVAPKSHQIIAIAALGEHLKPTVGPFKLSVGPILEKLLRNELGNWQQKHGGDVMYIRPNREINSLIEKPMDLFDFDIAHRTYDLARVQGEKLVQEWPSLADLAIRLSKQPV